MLLRTNEKSSRYTSGGNRLSTLTGFRLGGCPFEALIGLMGKLELRSRVELVRYAMEHGLFE